MKIAFVSQPIDPVLPKYKNSMGVLIYELARRISKTCEVTVYTKTAPGEQVEIIDGIAYRRIVILDDFRKLRPALRLLKRLHGKVGSDRPLFSSDLYYLDYALQVARDLRKRQCDLVHIVNFSQLAPIIKAFNPNIKIVLHMQCQWLSQLDHKLIARRLRHIDLVVGCSEYITQKVRNAFPQFDARCVTVYNGADLGRFTGVTTNGTRRSDEVMRLLFMGRISPEKGLHVLLEAMPRVLEKYPQAQLTVVGPKGVIPKDYIVSLSDDEKVAGLARFYEGADYFTQIQQQVSSLSLDDNVAFVGSIPHEQVIDYYRGADVFVIPSFSEAFPIILVEAMSCQLPIVATRVGGMSEVFRDARDAGLLIEPGDPAALADAIVQLLSDEKLRRAMGSAGRHLAVEQFSWDKAAASVLDLDRSLCGYAR